MTLCSINTQEKGKADVPGGAEKASQREAAQLTPSVKGSCGGSAEVPFRWSDSTRYL